MLREDTVNYSSLPQDEGTTPSSSFITSRSAPNVHNQRDFKIATILTIGVIVAGLGLAATLPFILHGISKDMEEETVELSDNQDDDDFLTSHLNAGKTNNATVNDADHILSNSSYDDVQDSATKSSTVEETTTKPAVVVSNEKIPMKPSPVLITFDDDVLEGHETTTPTIVPSSFKDDDDGASKKESSTSLDNGGMGSGADKNDGTGGDINDEIGGSDKKPIMEYVDDRFPNGNGGGSQSSVTSGPLPDTHISETHKDDMDMNQLLNEIYGEEGSAKPSSLNNDSWMSNAVSTGDRVTLVVLAAVVAVALAAVIASVAWLVYSRVASRRRRINIQNVITDLQSRDKIVLLNSESEEE